MMPSPSRPASAAAWGPPAATSSGIGSAGLSNSFASRAEVLPLERDVVLRPEPSDQLHRLAEPSQSLAGLGPRAVQQRHLVQRFAAADAEERTAGCEERDRGHRLRHDRGVIAERRRGHAGAETRARGARRGGAEPREREGRVTARVAPGMEVIAHRDAVEAELLGQHGVVEEPPGIELLRRRFPAER